MPVLTSIEIRTRNIYRELKARKCIYRTSAIQEQLKRRYGYCLDWETVDWLIADLKRRKIISTTSP